MSKCKEGCCLNEQAHGAFCIGGCVHDDEPKMSDLRKAFEKAIPMPKGIYWNGLTYSPRTPDDVESALDYNLCLTAFKAGLEAAAKVCDSMMHADRLTKEACAKYIRKLKDEATWSQT